MKKILIKIFMVFLTVFLLIWGVSILRCEILTYQYGSQFEKVYLENTMIGDVDYLKILNYTNDTAQVYYVSKNRSSGNILKFHKEKNKWVCSEWNTVWSKSGSADGFIWPYVR